MRKNNQIEGSKIIVSNLPNTTPRKDILEYLQTAGPIMDYSFDQCGQRFSATIVYYHPESAQIAKKFLDQRDLNARKIKITIMEKIYQQNDEKDSMSLHNRFALLDKSQKVKLFAYLKHLKEKEGETFQEFLFQNPDIVDILLGQ